MWTDGICGLRRLSLMPTTYHLCDLNKLRNLSACSLICTQRIMMIWTSEKIKQIPCHRCARACASVHSHTCAYARTHTLEIVLHWWYVIEEATFHFRFNRENMRCCLTTPKILLELFCIRKIIPLYTSFWILFIDSSKTDSWSDRL